MEICIPVTYEIGIKIKLLKENSVLPEKATKGSACYDVVATSYNYNCMLGLHEYGLGFATEIPEGYEGAIRPRSSISKVNAVIMNSPGTVDFDYTGEWIVKFKKLSETIYAPYKIGERIAQITFQKTLPITFITVENLTDTERGDGGFGSTNN